MTDSRFRLEECSVPGIIPGLLRRCSPILQLPPYKQNSKFDLPAHLRASATNIRRGVWFPGRVKDDEGSVCWDKWADERWEGPVYAGRVRLDLTDWTGRQHGLLWAAAKQKGLSTPLPGLTTHNNIVSLAYNPEPGGPRLPDGSLVSEALFLRNLIMRIYRDD